MAVEPDCIEDAARWLQTAFCPEAADGAVAYRIELSGSGGGALLVRVQQGRLETEILREDEGTGSNAAAASADVTFSMTAADFYGILSGRENPDLLFMAERLRVDGELSLALKLRSLFQAPL